VKLTYLVVSYSRLAPSAAVNEDSTTDTPAMIWATSQYVDISTDKANELIFTDKVLSGSTNIEASAKGCGLHYDSGTTRWRFGIRCDKTPGAAAVGATPSTAKVDYDVAVHTYIMGFHFAADTKSVESELAVQAEYNGFTSNTPPVNKYELAFYDDTGAGGNRDRKFIND
jgi:hypothetical protein